MGEDGGARQAGRLAKEVTSESRAKQGFGSVGTFLSKGSSMCKGASAGKGLDSFEL